MLHAEADQNDSGGEMDAGRTTACLWMEMHFVLLVHIFCSLVFLSMVFGGCVCICIGLHLEPTAVCPFGKGSILAFGIGAESVEEKAQHSLFRL